MRTNVKIALSNFKFVLYVQCFIMNLENSMLLFTRLDISLYFKHWLSAYEEAKEWQKTGGRPTQKPSVVSQRNAKTSEVKQPSNPFGR